MSKPFTEQVYEDARAAGCDHDLAVLIVLHVTDPQNATALATAVTSATVPDYLKRSLLRNTALKTDAQRIAAFRQAEEVQFFVSMSGVPEHLRDIGKFTVRDTAGNVSLMPSAHVGRTIWNTMAAADQNIDTSRPDADSRGAARPLNEFDALAVEAFAKLAKARKGATQ